MESLVVDSGVAVKWFVPEDGSDRALEILKDYRDDKLSFLAPSLIHAEYGNIIWKKQILQNFDPADAEFAINEFRKINFMLTTTTALFDDAYKIAVKHKRTFYDSLYLALAAREGCRFVTADEKLYNAVSSDFSNIVWLANWK